MVSKFRRAALAAMLFGAGAVGAFGADVDLAPGAAVATGQDGLYFVHNTDTTDNTIQNTNITDDIVLGSAAANGSNYVVGASGGTGINDLVRSEGTVGVQLRSVDVNGNALTVVNSDNPGAEGTSVALTTLNANAGGTIAIGDSVAATDGRFNQIYATTLNANGSGVVTDFNIGADSRLVVRNTATLGSRTGSAVNFTMGNDSEAGYAEFRNGMTLENGRITGNSHIKGNVTLDGPAAIADASNRNQLYEGNLTIGANGGQVVVGTPGATADSNMEVTGRLTVNGTSGPANAFATVGGTDETSRGTLTVGDLALTGNGTVNVGAYGTLVVGQRGGTTVTNLNDGYVNIGNNGLGASGLAVFNNDVNLNNNSVIYVDGAKVVFGGALAMHSGAAVNLANGGVADVSRAGSIASGSIGVSGAGNSLVVGSGLTLKGAGVIRYDATVATNELSIQRADNGALGQLSIARAGAIDFSNAGGVSTLNVGDLVVTGTANGNLYTGAFGSAVVNAQSFTVERGADVRGRADVTTNVDRRALIQGKFDTAGTENFLRGLQVNGGELAAGVGSAVVNIGDAAVRSANVVVTNGTLSSAAGNTLTLNNAHATNRSSLIFTGNQNTVRGDVIASGGAGFDIRVDGNIDLSGNNTSLTGDSYSQTGGTVQSTNGRFQSVNVVGAGVSTISGWRSVFATSANFDNGVSFLNGATLRSVDTHTLAINGNNLITTDFRMGADTLLDLSDGDINVSGFENVSVLGRMRLGYVGGQTTMLNTLGSGRTTVNLGKIELADSFVNGYTYNASGLRDYIAYDQSTPVNARQAWRTISNVFGDYTFHSLEGDGAWLESVAVKDVTDVNGVRASLAEKWGLTPTSHSFASNVSAVAQNLRNPALGARPFGTMAGTMNYNVLKAYALGNDSFSFTHGGGSYSGILDKGLHAAYNGSVAAGVTYVSQDVAREIITTLHGRVADIRDLRNSLEAVGSTTALGSLPVGECLNNQYLNRIWAGGLGLWQNADQRKGFDGYKYDGHGVIMGYDRALDNAGAFIGGISAAYMKGDYKDKTAAAHDSEIKHYAADAYITYNAMSGFYATLMGGYTYSDNDIREFRGGHWAGQDYHTDTWRVGGRVGYDFAPAENFTMSPSVGVNFLHSRSSGHQMTLNNVNLLSYGNMRNHNVEIPVEMRMAYNIPMGEEQDLTLMANGGYAYNLNDHGVSGSIGLNDMNGVTPIRAAGRKLGHNSWTGGVGAKYRQGQWDVGVKYDYTGRGNFDGHRLMGTVGYSF